MKTIKENKKIILGFMNIKPRLISPDVYGYSDLPFFSVTNDTPELVLDAMSEYVKYDTSWDCLMPVIRKIIKIIGVKTIDECSNEEWFQSTRITQMYVGIDIAVAFEYVCEYIKWYNKQK